MTTFTEALSELAKSDRQFTDMIIKDRDVGAIKAYYERESKDRSIGYMPPAFQLHEERTVLGCLIFSDDALQLVDDLITPESFSRPGHGRLYSKLRYLIRSGTQRTLETLEADSPARVNYLRKLLAASATTIAVRWFADCIRKAAIERATSMMQEAA
jgi:hypothetical protein